MTKQKFSKYLPHVFFPVVLALLVSIPSVTISAPTQDKIKASYLKSYNYESVGNYENAIHALSRVYKHYPDAYTVNLRLAYLSRLNGNYPNAVKHYKKSSAALESALSPKLGLMLVYIAQGEYEESAALGYQILQSDYLSYYGNLRLAYTLRLQRKYELANEVLQKMLIVYPADVYYLSEYGSLLYASGKSSDALITMNNVLILDPENITATYIIDEIQSAKTDPLAK